MLEPQPSLREAAQRLSEQGWVLFPAMISPDDLGPIREAVLASVEHCGRRQVASGACSVPDGTAHHSVGQYPALDAFLERRWLHGHIDEYFAGAPYILHAFNPALVAPQGESYLHNIHRDVRTHAGEFRLLLNMLVMVDPFTLENGATHVLSGSHRQPRRPDPDLFWAKSERLVGPAGSIVLFELQPVARGGAQCVHPAAVRPDAQLQPRVRQTADGLSALPRRSLRRARVGGSAAAAGLRGDDADVVRGVLPAA